MSQDRMLALARRFAELAPAQRRVFLAKLAEQNIDFGLLPIPPRAAGSNTLPASFAQARLWFLWRMEPASSAYNVAGRLDVAGELDEAALRQAFAALIDRHETLRTTFRADANGDAEQLIHAALPLDFVSEDLSGLAEQEIERRSVDEGLKPFDLEHGPLLRVRLLRRAENDHRLLITLHHIATDGWSSGVMMRELAELYGAAREGRAARLAESPLQYADYALWQRHWLEAGEAERQLGYWTEQLGAHHPVLELPIDKPRPAEQDFAGARHFFTLDAALGGQLRELAQQQGTTLFMVLLAAFHTLLYRYTGQADLRVGIPVAGRTRSETEGMIGFFINTQVIRTEPGAATRFVELLAEVKRRLLGAQSHQELPFEQLVEALGAARGGSHHPLFQVMANHETWGALPAWPGLSLSENSPGNPTAKFDLSLATEEDEHGALRGALVYATALFEPATIARMAEHYVMLLKAVVADAGQHLGELAMLTEAELADFKNWNGAQRSPDFVPVHRQLSAQAAARGEAVALLSSAGNLSWAELDTRANQLAHRLIAVGVGAEVRVGVSVERGVEMIVALLAVLKTGGAFVPLDPGYPAERLGYMLGDAGIAQLVTHSTLAERVARPGLNVLCVDDVSLANEPSHDPTVTIHPEQAAYLIYTSGSTGQPKGVTVAHGPLAMHCAAIAARYQLTDADRVLHFASINFDLAHEYWLMPLITGASLLISDPALWSPAEMIERLAEHRVSVAAFPPSYLTQVAEAQRQAAIPAQLRVLAFGGEALSAEGFAAVRRAFPSTTLINGYGPTETVISPMLWVTGPDADPASWAHCAYLPIGSVIGARQAHVLDDALNPLPVGVAGELYLGGEGVARGYHARAGLTAERFVPDPFGVPGSRLYRTGDLARWRSDGAIDYLGRADHQVKLRGLRIELGEIETQLLRCPNVREAVVWVQGADAHQRLVGYLVAQQTTELDLAAIKAQLATQLPDYMVPSQWRVLEALPVNGAGKVDRKALPVPEWQGRPYRAPQGELEQTLAAIWAEVLKLDQVGRDDHFFELGGHSLLATQVTARIQQRLARAVPLKMLFQAPTLADFAAAVAEQSDSARLVPLTRRAPGARVPPTPAQQELWFLSQLDPDNTAWNLACAYRCRGHLDRAAVQWAFDRLVERHVALRTTFRVCADGEVEQWVHAPYSPALAYTDLSALAATEREAEARSLIEEEDLRPFNLQAGPLLRLGLIRLAADEQVLLITLHHSMADGLSMSVLFDEFAELYRAKLAGAAPQLPALAVDYADFALWQRQASDAAACERELDYWTGQLAGMPLMALPAVADAPTLPSPAGEQLYFELEPTLAEYARAFALRHGTSLSMVLQAALNAALYRHAGALDQGIGIISATRQRLEAERLVGLLFNMQVLRSRIDPAAGFAALLEQVKAAALGAHAHPELPMHELVAALQPQRHGAPYPLFRVLYNFQRPDHVGLAPLPGIEIEDFSAERRTVVCDLEFNVVEHPDGLVTAAFAYATEVVDGVFAHALKADYPLLLARLLAEPARALVELAGPLVETAVSGAGEGAAAEAPLAVPPRDGLEMTLAALWSELLGVADIGIHDNFFALGGDSMLTLKLVALARRQGIPLTIAQLFTHQTIAELASALAMSQAATQPALASR